jgi:hypothetical protein
MLNIKDKTSVVFRVIGKNKHKTHIALRMIFCSRGEHANHYTIDGVHRLVNDAKDYKW